VARQGRFELPR